MNRQLPKLCLFALFISAAPFAQALDTKWMAPVLKKQRCIEALGLSVLPEECWTWSKRETASPVVDPADGRIFIGGTDGFLHVLEPVQGKTLKRLKLEGSLVSAPVVVESALIVATDKGFLYKIAKSDLSVSFKTELDSGILQTPYLLGDRLLVVTQIGTLYAVSAQTGEIVWTKKRDLPNRIFLRHLSTPIAFNSLVNGSNREVLALGNPNGKLEFLDAANGDVVDEMMLGSSKEPFGDVATTPVVYKDILYAASFNQALVAIDSASRVRKWELKEKGITQLATSDGFVIAAGAKFVMGIDAFSGKVLWKFAFKKGAPSLISISEGKILVGSDTDALYVLDLITGEPLQVLGSGLGIVGKIQKMGHDWLAMSAGGTLFRLSR